MQWIHLIGDKSLNLNRIEGIDHYGSLKSYFVDKIPGRYCIEYCDGHIFYDMNDDLEGFDDDLITVPFKKPNIITVVYTDKNRIKSVISQENYLKNIYVDNDFGLIVPISRFIQLGMPLDSDDMKEIFE